MQQLLTKKPTLNISNAYEQEARYLIFEIYGEEYGIEVLRVKEIISMVKITPVPKTPEYVKGIINLRGNIIPVIDLQLKLGIRETVAGDDRCIIIVETRNGLKGIIVDMVSEVLVVNADDMEPSLQLKSSIDAAFLMGIAKIKGKLKLLLNIDNIFGADGRQTHGEKNNQINENKKDLYRENSDDEDFGKEVPLIQETENTEGIFAEKPKEEIRREISDTIKEILPEDSGTKENAKNETAAIDEKQTDIILSDTACTLQTIGTDKADEPIDLNAVAKNISVDIREATTSLFETMIMMDMKFKEYALVDETKIKSDVVCMISFTGKYHGIVSLFCSKELALQVASNMLMEEQTTLSTEVKDAVGEVLNMIAGGVKTKIAEKYGEMYLSIPLVIVGEDISVSVTETQEMRYKTTVVCFTKDPWITTRFGYNDEIMTVGLLLKKTSR
ncbi:chemotaxis protein CheW [Candidatus Kuenenia sp.]|uniref:chemotaxis protein CheW n=1 Tax=Candidatus Kuenenia sp. TaxID=2499824 RepID=UPI0032208AE8